MVKYFIVSEKDTTLAVDDINRGLVNRGKRADDIISIVAKDDLLIVFYVE